ncbi:MAG: hypothetical protein R6V44_06790 [Paracoccaceae bacterium]
MGPQLVALVRDALEEGAELVAGRVLLVAVPAVLGAVSVAFLGVAGYVALLEALGPQAAALIFAAGFAVLALAALLVVRARARRHRRLAAEARAQLAEELSALRAVVGARRSGAPAAAAAAFVAAFVLARRS